MNFEWLSAFAQAWDASNTLKFITKKQEKFYAVIDGFYKLERRKKTGGHYTGRGKYLATVHQWVSDYENTKTTCGSPIDGYVEDGSWTNLRQQDGKQSSRVLTGELRGDGCPACKAVLCCHCTDSAVTLCQSKTESRVLDSSRHCYTAENRHGSIGESLFPM